MDFCITAAALNANSAAGLPMPVADELLFSISITEMKCAALAQENGHL
jgi:hypothetical protein